MSVSTRRLPNSPIVAALVTGALLIAAFGGVAWATTSSSAVISACYQKVGGQLRIIDPSASSCRPSEQAISWNQEGPQGPPGGAGVTTFNVRFGGLAPGTQVARAFCLPGEKLTGGGGLATNPASAGLTQNTPISDTTGTIASGTDGIGWQVASEGFGAVQAYAICAS